MPLGWTVEQFNEWIDSTFPDNQTRLISEADLRDGLKRTVLKNDERAAAMEAMAEQLNSNFVSRSLKLSAVVYLDGTNGNDANTGSSQGLAIKSMARLIELYSGKCVNLSVFVTGTIEISSNLTLSIPFIWFLFNPDGKFYIRKLASNNGNYKLLFASNSVQFCTYGGGLGELIIEGHGGNITDETAINYASKQGGIRLLKTNFDDWRSGFSIQSISINVVQLTVGDNATLLCGHEDGPYTNEFTKSSFLFLGTIYGPTLGVGSTMEAGFHGNRIFPRIYTPTSSTDSNVLEKELVTDINYLYRKSGGTIKKIAWTSF